MATLICIFGYVITIISILSNAQILIPVNENNQYPNVNAIAKVNGTNTVAYVTVATMTTAADVSEKLSNDDNSMQLKDDSYLLAEQDRQKQNQYEPQQKNEIQANSDKQRTMSQQHHQQQQHTHTQTAFRFTNEFMNETENRHNHSDDHKNSVNDDVNAINVMRSKAVTKTTSTTPSTASTPSDLKTNSRKTIDYSMKMVRDNGNDADSYDTDESIVQITQLPIDNKSGGQSFESNVPTETNYYNENSDDGLKLNLSDELSIDSIADTRSSDVNEPANTEPDDFEELTLDDEVGTKKSDVPHRQKNDFDTQNIYKVAKPNKSKQLKAMASASTSVTPRILHMSYNRKSMAMPGMREKQFLHPKSFEYITQLYDQYQWNVSDFSSMVSPKCTKNMDVFLSALQHGRTWASKGNF